MLFNIQYVQHNGAMQLLLSGKKSVKVEKVIQKNKKSNMKANQKSHEQVANAKHG